MDLYKAIRELYEEKKRLDEVIASLEAFLASKAGLGPELEQFQKRRGRKSMSPEERKQVSERMKEYWASRRRQNTPA